MVIFERFKIQTDIYAIIILSSSYFSGIFLILEKYIEQPPFGALINNQQRNLHRVFLKPATHYLSNNDEKGINA